MVGAMNEEVKKFELEKAGAESKRADIEHC